MSGHKQRQATDLTDKVLERLGYEVRTRGRWWNRDRSVLSTVVFGALGLVVVMGVLAILEARRDTSKVVNIVGDGQAVSQAIRQTRSSFSEIDDALFRVFPMDLNSQEPALVESPDRGVLEPSRVLPEEGNSNVQQPWFEIEATSSGAGRYERVVAEAPWKST